MRKRINYLPLVIMMMVMAMVSCSESTDCAKLIPDDAVMLMRIDVKQIADKSGSGNKQVKSKVLEMLDGESMSNETRDKLKKIIDDPVEAGIDLREPLLIYMTVTGRNPDGGLIGKVHDAGKLTELLNTVAKEEGSAQVKEKGDISYLYNNGAIMAYNDGVFCFRNTKEGEDKAAETMTRLLAGEMGYTKGESDNVKKLLAAGGVMQVLIGGEIAETVPEFKAMKQSMPEGAEMKDVAYLLDLNMDKGKAVLKYEVLAASDAWEKAIKESDKLYKPIDGDLLEYISRDGLAMILNCDGKKLMEYLEAHGFAQIVGKSNMPMAKNLVSTINGNIALDVRDIDMRAGMPTVAFYAKTENSTITDMAGAMLRGQAVTGYKDGTSYLLLGAQKEPFKSPANAIEKGDAKGKRLYILFNFDVLKSTAKQFRGQQAMAMQAAAQVIEKAELNYAGDGKGELTVTMRDKDKNPLEVIGELGMSSLN